MTRLEGPLVRFLTLWLRPWGRRRAMLAAGVLLAIGAATLLVYVTGGIKFVFSHSMYLPILFAGAVFGPVGGVVTGVVGGLTLGPFMPIDTMTGEAQLLINWLYRMVFFVLAGGVTGALVIAITRLASRDPVSGVPSQVPLRAEMHRIIERGEGGNCSEFSLLLVKLANHAEVVGTFGTSTGQQLLRGFVGRLRAANGAQIRVYHLHAETFGLIVPRAELPAVRERIRDAMRAPVDAKGVPVHLEVLIGRADFPEHARVADGLVQQATVALQLAREPSNGELVYDAELEARNRRNLLLLSGLGPAITDEQLELHYQPQFHLAEQRTCGVEALVRWQHPEHGLLLPEMFLPQAETTELMHALTAWVIDRALADVAALRGDTQHWRVAVNLSARNLHHPGLFEAITTALDRHGVAAHHLEVEVTESTVLSDPVAAQRLLSELRAIGVTVAIDDFGVGSTSLGYLKDLPANRLKVDRRFVGNLADDERDRAIVAAVTTMAHEFGMDVVAEGVEDEATLEELAAIGCDVAQGFLLGRPAPLERLLAERR